MKLSPHLIAAIVTVLAIALFLLLRSPLHIVFGLRTWWPAFFVMYVLALYYARVSGSRAKEERQ